MAVFCLGALACSPEGNQRGADPGTGGSGEETAGAGGSAGASGTGGKTGTGGSGAADAAAEPGVKADAAAAPDTAAADTSSTPAGDAGATAPPMGAVASTACGGTAVMPGPNGTQNIMATGKNRSFIIRMPTGYDGKKPFPVMFAFHGAGGGASAFEGGVFGSISRMAADKAIRIFPQAFGGNTWSRDENDDVLYMDALMKWLDEKVCFDKATVFASGQSSGAYFSHRWACDRGGVVRGVATNSGGQRRERALDCKVAISAWTSTGLGDNPGHVMGTRQASEVWRKLAGCSTESEPVQPAPCKAYTGCRPGFAVHHCEHGGGHAVPGYGAAGIYGFLFGGKYLGGAN